MEFARRPMMELPAEAIGGIKLKMQSLQIRMSQNVSIRAL
jgi:hypothetical protein